MIFWIVAVLAVVFSYFQTKRVYESTAKVLVSLGSEAQGRAEYLNNRNLQVTQRDQQIHNEQQILQSHDVLVTTAEWLMGDAAAGEPPSGMADRISEASRFVTGQEPEPTLVLRTVVTLERLADKITGVHKTHAEKVEEVARSLSKALTVNTVFNADALDISFKYRDPRVAQTILQLILAAYIHHHIAVFQSNAESSLLKSQLDRSVDEYHDRLSKLSSFMSQNRVFNDDAQATGLIAQHDKLEGALQDALAERASATKRLNALRNIRETVDPFERYSSTDVRNKVHDELSTQLADAQVELDKVLTRHPVGSRAYQDQQARVDAIRKQLTQEPAQVPDQTEHRRSKSSELIDSDMITAGEVQHGDDARIAQLRDALRDVNAQLDAYAHGRQGFDAIQLDLAFAKQESQRLGEAYVDSRLRNLTAQSAITSISVIDTPTQDTTPLSPKKSIVFLEGIALLVLGSFALLFLRGSLDSTMADSQSAAARLGIPVTATLPDMGLGDDDSPEFHDMFFQDHDREFARIYQTCRASDAGRKVVLLAESNEREGASLIGYGLARFFEERAGQRVAFLDCTQNRIAQEIRHAPLEGHEVTHVQWPIKEHKTNGKLQATAAIFSRLLADFDYVIVAGGAVKDATDWLDTSNIASHAFLIVEAGTTRLAAARNSLDVLRSYGFSRISLILNRRVFYVPQWLMRFV